jgi:hypothetical protein
VALLMASSSLAQQLSLTSHLMSERNYRFCGKPRGVPTDGAIVHFRSRYLLMCAAPLHPHGERMGLLSVNSKILNEVLEIDSFNTIRMDARFPREELFQRHLRRFDRNGEQSFGGVNYKKFESKFVVPKGHHRDLLFEYSAELNPQQPDLPSHWYSCAYSVEEPRATQCRLNVAYYGINASVLFLRFREYSHTMPWEEVPKLATEIIKILEYADVTSDREIWPEDTPIYE